MLRTLRIGTDTIRLADAWTAFHFRGRTFLRRPSPAIVYWTDNTGALWRERYAGGQWHLELHA